jgi:cell wall-associated NlpC family hydrolase
MNAHHSLQKSCWHFVYLSALAMLLGACSSTPSRQTGTPPTPVPVNDTREPAPDTADQPQTQTPDTQTGTTTETPQDESRGTFGEEVALRAIALVGKPYRYGGADLNGFDCSGLVFYIYHELGVELPRSAAEQQRYAAKISRDDLLPGDLIFFRINRKRISHVGIYVGDNRFVHAPQSGKQVVIRNLDDDYYAKHWVSAGRIN